MLTQAKLPFMYKGKFQMPNIQKVVMKNVLDILLNEKSKEENVYYTILIIYMYICVTMFQWHSSGLKR